MPIISQYRSKIACLFFPMAFAAFLNVIIALVWLVIGGGSNAVLMLVAAFSLLVLISWLWMNLTTSYEFDAGNGQVWHCIKLGTWQRRTLLCRFDEVAAFTVKGIHNRARVQTWWEYQVAMLQKSGRFVAVAETSPKSVYDSNRYAEKLAVMVGCEYFPGTENKTVSVALAGENPVIEYRDWNWGDVAKEFGLATIASIAFFCAIVAFIVALVVMLS